MTRFTFGVLAIIAMSVIIGTSMTHADAAGNAPTTVEETLVINRVDFGICSVDMVQTNLVVETSLTTWPNGNNFRYSEIITKEFLNMDNELVGTFHGTNTIHGEFDGTGSATTHFKSNIKCVDGTSQNQQYVVILNKNGSITHGKDA